MAKFFNKLFNRGSSFNGSQTSLSDTPTRSKTSSNVRTSASLENLASYHVTSKELEKNKLHKAAWEGNYQKVVRLARPGQINLKDQQMRTPLHLAVVKGHIEIVDYLVHEDAKLDVIDKDRRTPLIKAVLSGNQNPRLNYQICEVLIKGGAGDYINATDNNSRSALHYAIDFGNHDLVALFLSTDNCDPNLQDHDQMTPLHLAIKRNSPAIVQLLLSNQRDQQADPNIGNRYGQTPLHLAASVGYIDIVRLLVQSNLKEPCDPTIHDSQQQTAYESAKQNHQEACAKLIEEYEHKYNRRPLLRRQTTTSLHEQSSIKANSSVSMIPAANLQRNRDETSDDSSSSSSSSITTTKPSKATPRRTKRPSDQWSDDYNPTTQGITSLFQTNPLRPTQTNQSTSSTLESLLANNPLETKAKKTNATSQQSTRSTSFFGIGPVIERMDSENTSTSISAEKPAKPVAAAAAIATVPNKPTISKLVSDSKSWSDDTTLPSPRKSAAAKINSWDTSTSDDDFSEDKPNKTVTNLITTQPFAPPADISSSSDSENNSVSTEIRKIDTSNKKSTTNTYKVIGINEVPSPRSEDSSWTTSPVPFNQPLPPATTIVKDDDSTWDDSRPITDSKGVDNLVKMIDTIIDSDTKKPAQPKVVGKLVVSTMKEHSNDSSERTTTDKRELRESMKRLEQTQDETRELREQLKDMEERKNNYEKLYKENDEIRREFERKLQQEKSEKQRLQTTTEDLHEQLNNVRLKLQKIEFEKEFFNKRCSQLEQQLPNSVYETKQIQTDLDDKFFQQELERLQIEKNRIEQEKFEYKSKYDILQEEIRVILIDRSKLERKLTEEFEAHFQDKQRSTNDVDKYRSQIDELNMKLSDAQARLVELKAQNEILTKTTTTTTKQEHRLTQPLTIQTDQQILTTTTATPEFNNENYLIETSRQIRSNTERVKSQLDRLRDDFDRIISTYEPNNKYPNQTQIHSQVDTFRYFYENEYRQRQAFMSNLNSSLQRHSSLRDDQLKLNATSPYPINGSSKPIPRQASTLLTMSSIDFARKHYQA